MVFLLLLEYFIVFGLKYFKIVTDVAISFPDKVYKLSFLILS